MIVKYPNLNVPETQITLLQDAPFTKERWSKLLRSDLENRGYQMHQHSS
jgi:hypothetical protein